MVNSTHPSLLYSVKYTHSTEIYRSVYVPSSPFNIIPPKIIIADLNTKDKLDVDYAKHDDTEYIIIFKNNYLRLPYRSLTIPIEGNCKINLWNTPVYNSLCAIAINFKCYECYSVSHLIADSDEYSDIYIGNPR